MFRLLLLCSLVGCWKVDRAEPPAGEVAFQPGGVEVAGWVVTEAEVGLRCPDGRQSRFLFVAPRDQDGPLDTAVLFHSGAFDYVVNPVPEDPLQGAHLADVDRLNMPFAVRMAYSTLGMFPSPLVDEGHQGTMAAALVARDVALVVPTNCWGDLWHNEPGAADNAFEQDFFFRSGRAAAEWPFRLLQEPLFREAIRVELPFEPSDTLPLALGFGEGGRAIGEVLHLDDDGDGQPDWPLGGILVDSHIEDLSVFVGTVEEGPGLERIFPAGNLDDGALETAPTLPPTAWVYSAVDGLLPPGSQDRMLARLGSQSRHRVLEQPAAMHVFSNDDAELADEIATFLTGISTP